jgi:hypothetical protein
VSLFLCHCFLEAVLFNPSTVFERKSILETTTTLRGNKELVDAIADLARKAEGSAGKAHFLEIPDDPNGDLLLIKPDGSYELFQVPCDPRSTTLLSVDQIAPFALNAIYNWGSRPNIYYGPSAVTVRLEDSSLVPSNAGKAHVNLGYSQQFTELQKWSVDHNKAFHGHKRFMQLMRLVFATCLEPSALKATLDAIGGWVIEESEKTGSVVARGREQLGKEVKAELRSVKGEIPEQLTLQVRVFNDPALLRERRIRCSLEIEPTNGGQFALIPEADEIDRAIDEEMKDLGELLQASVNGLALPSPQTVSTVNMSGDQDSASAKQQRYIVPIFYGSF